MENFFRKTFFLLSVILCVFVIESCSDDNSSSANDNGAIYESKIKVVLDSVIGNTHVPGLVAGVWSPDKGVDLIYTAGVSNLNTNAAMDADFYFRIGSNTKTFVITVFLQLVEEELLSLDDKLSVYFPEFPRADEVTLAMLTDMRSGIYDYLETTEFEEIVFSNLLKEWTVNEKIALVLGYEYYFDPGTAWMYSNTNTIMLGAIIEQVTGNSLAEEIGSRILQPLNLTKTFFPEKGTEIPSPHSAAYYIGEYSEDKTDLCEAFDISWAGAAGNMISTLDELRTYAEALVGGNLLSATMHQQRIQSCLPVADGSKLLYGYGLMSYEGYYGHNGGMPGYTSLMLSNPVDNSTIIIWYNCQIEGSTPTDIMDRVVGILNGD